METLGAITVITTDKTGTLTENRMQVSRLAPKTMNQRLLELGTLCNDVMEDSGEGAGDPLETALLRAAREAGLDVKALRADAPLHNEFTFDNVRKRMSVVVSCEGQFLMAVKGAHELRLFLSAASPAPARRGSGPRLVPQHTVVRGSLRMRS